MNCKPGDLAIVIRGTQVGMIVSVIGSEVPFDDWSPAWHATTDRPVQTIKRRSRRVSQATEFRVRDSWLRPVSGLPIEDEVKDEVTA